GAGVVTAGEMLLAAAARAGRYGMMVRAVGPQIRGGESAALIRLGHSAINCLDDRCDVLVGIDWKHAERFLDDIVLDADSIVVSDPAKEPVPDPVRASGAEIHELAMSDLAESLSGGRSNMVALGCAARLAAIPDFAVMQGPAGRRCQQRGGDARIRPGRQMVSGIAGCDGLRDSRSLVDKR
ncbi:MAG: 2-oxoacid:acceptor oxidoreductase family protein, partial [Woeseiaceae bacterium]